MTIKFRGKTKEGKWVYGNYHETNTDGYKKHFILPEKDWKYTYEFEVIEETVGQFTGLYNFKQKEIYQGDILDEDGYIYVVEWNYYGWYIKQVSNPEDDEDYSAYLSSHDITGNSEVIGNIHDNSDLLK